LGYNYVGTAAGYAFSGDLTGNQVGNNPPLSSLLGPLQNNGGPTLTRLPAGGGPLVNAGDPAVATDPPNDQRGSGFPRVSGGRADVGAAELAAAADLQVTLTDNVNVVRAGGTTTYTLVARNAGPGAAVGAGLTMTLPVGAGSMTWTSAAAGGATGNTPGGGGTISESLGLPAGASGTYT